jgi:hypothetical protein
VKRKNNSVGGGKRVHILYPCMRRKRSVCDEEGKCARRKRRVYGGRGVFLKRKDSE